MGFLFVANKSAVDFRDDGKGLRIGKTVKFYLVFQNLHDTERYHVQNHRGHEHVWKNGRSAVTRSRLIPKMEPATMELVEYLNVTPFRYYLLDFSSRSKC